MAESRKLTLEAIVPSESATAGLFKQVDVDLVVGCVSGTSRLVLRDENNLIVPIAAKRTGAVLVDTISDLQQPWGVAVNSKDQVIVVQGRKLADVDDEQGCRDKMCCVTIFSSLGKMIKTFGKFGHKDGEFDTPRGVAVDDEDNIYVVDKGNSRIQKFSPDGKHMASVGTNGIGQLQFNWPKGIGIHPHTKNVYVTEAGNHCVQILKSDFTFISVIGAKDKDGKPTKGNGDGEFNMPMGVAFDKSGLVYVTDAIKEQIQVFSKDGEFIAKFGVSGNGNGELKFPCAVCVDENDLLYVTEGHNFRISVFKIDGNSQLSHVSPKFLTTFAHRTSRDVCYQGGIAVGKQGIVYVSDDSKDDVQMFLV